MSKTNSARLRPYPGPKGDDRTYYLPRDLAEWEEAFKAYHIAAGFSTCGCYLAHEGRTCDGKNQPVVLDERRQPEEQAPVDPERKARFNEAVAYIRDYTGTWGLVLDLRANPKWGTKWFRLSDRQVEVLLQAKARDAARLVEQAERKATGLDLTGLPKGTTRYAVPNASGDLTFIRVDHVDDGKWEGWVFVKQVIGGGVPGMNVEERLGAQRPGDAYKGSFESLLRLVLADPEEAARRYGLELGQCSVCGRTLTNAESREAGIGPECSKKWSAAA